MPYNVRLVSDVDDVTALELLAAEIQLARAVSVIEQPLELDTTPFERVAVPPPKRCSAFGVIEGRSLDGKLRRRGT